MKKRWTVLLLLLLLFPALCGCAGVDTQAFLDAVFPRLLT